MRAEWTASGACTRGSIAPPRGAMRQEFGGAATTSTAMTSASAAAPIADRDGDGRRFATAAAPEHDVASGSAGNGNAAADWLSLAAAPTFASMALLTGVSSGGPSHMLCLAGQ